MSGPSGVCPHVFVRFRWWPVKLRFQCLHCGLITRRYDDRDKMAFRPVHRHMSVVFKGVNDREESS